VFEIAHVRREVRQQKKPEYSWWIFQQHDADQLKYADAILLSIVFLSFYKNKGMYFLTL